MKKTTSSLLKLLLRLALVITALLPQRAEAATASLSGSGTVQAGSTVKLTLSVSGSGIMGVDATLDYDSSVLEFTNYDNQLSGWTMVNDGMKFVLYGVDPISSSSVLSVTFRVKSNLDAGTALSASFKNITVSDGTADTSLSPASWSGKVDAPLSSNCDLGSLSCSNATLSPAFNKSTTYYTAKVPYAVESLNLNYKAADGSAKVSVSGNSLVVGSNTVTVTCTAATGAKKTYTISVTREQDPNYKPSTDATLKELTLDVGTLSPTFSGAVTDYVAYVPYETKAAKLTGVAKDEKALKVTEASAQLFQEGDTVMTVTCTAEDGTTAKTYTVHVYRMPKYEGIIPTMEIIDPNIPPEPPTYSVPMTVTLPLVGEMATTTALIIAAALLVIILLLVGFLLGRIGHNGGNDDYDDGGDDDDDKSSVSSSSNAAPVIPTDYSVATSNMVKEIRTLAAGSNYEINLTKSNSVVKKLVIKQIAGKDITITITHAGHTWTVNGKDVDTAKPLNFRKALDPDSGYKLPSYVKEVK